MNKYLGILVSLIAGLSTIIGYFAIYIKGDKRKIISYFLSFSAGVMIMLSIIDLIPSGVKYLIKEDNLVICIIVSFLAGFLVSYITEKCSSNNDELYSTGIISMVGFILHNIPEGIVTYALSTVDLKLGILLAFAIMLHNIPEGISIAIPIYYSTKNKKKSFFYTAIAGLSEPFGAVISFIFLSKYINTFIMGFIYIFVAGLMIYIAIFQLIKTSKKYNKNVNYFTLYGAIFILLIEIILKI